MKREVLQTERTELESELIYTLNFDAIGRPKLLFCYRIMINGPEMKYSIWDLLIQSTI